MPIESAEDPPPYLEQMHATSSSVTSLVLDRPKTMYFHGGIGGAGNYRKIVRDDITDSVPKTSTRQPTRQPNRSHLPKSLKKLFSSGIGGAGNMHTRAEEAALSAEEEAKRAKIREAHLAQRWFVGIGGMGNRRGMGHQNSLHTLTSTSTGSSLSHIGAAETTLQRYQRD
ncbi:MAG: hypothetical protein Q9195_001554 [Heterodermia aff. obscurata]